MNNIRDITLAKPEHPLEPESRWCFGGPSFEKGHWNRVLLTREDFKTLKVGDHVRVFTSEGKLLISEAVVKKMRRDGSVSGQPFANVQALDKDSIAMRDLAFELEFADRVARMHWVPSPPPPPRRVVRSIVAEEFFGISGHKCKDIGRAFRDPSARPTKGEMIIVNGEMCIAQSGWERVPDGMFHFTAVAIA